ncbi:MAG: type II and III secretion system protein [Puniceicoccales bacterium]|jgi:general secretion pathway protein D|nr:type II and III secretion system protein [Puniceicoccales bacterium]
MGFYRFLFLFVLECIPVRSIFASPHKWRKRESIDFYSPSPAKNSANCDESDRGNGENRAEIPRNESIKISKKGIGRLLLKARSLLLVNSLEEAYEIAQIILKSDPNNGQALSICNYVKQNKLESNEIFPNHLKETKDILLKNIQETWETPKIIIENIPLQEEQKEWNDIFHRLNRITIPKIFFNNTPMSQAIDSIIALSEQYDGEQNSPNRGVNIILITPPEETEPTLTLNLKNMPLDKILNFIAKASGYQFDIEDGVMIFRKMEGNLSENLDTKFFNISRSAIVRMTGIQSSNSNGNNSNISKVSRSKENPSNKKDKKEGESAPKSSENEKSEKSKFQENSENSSSSGPIAREEKLIKEFLQKAGVNFSGTRGSNLAYDGSQLIVTQTLRNIKRVKEILAKYEQIKQVEIETKFIEVQQSKLDELQFGWNMGFTWKNSTGATKTNREISLLTNGKDQGNSLRTLNDAFNVKNASGGEGSIVLENRENPIKIPSSMPGSLGGMNLGLSMGNLGNFTGVIGDKISLGLTLRALEQQSDSDLMSAPKLTVLSGKTAKIVVAQEFIYPKTWGQISSQVGTGDANSAGVTITAGTPSDFQTRNVGVEMNVTPTVEENNCISLQLAPKVTEFEGFIEYGGRSVAIQGNTTVQVPPGFYQPIFSTREIQTEVTIYDGATVVMGGLTREEVKEVHDKVPLLGDIPIIGKLFRSKGETTQKKNLLIFVTANILSPGGTPLRTQDRKGKKEPVYRTTKENL